jgi:hypothetical protein
MKRRINMSMTKAWIKKHLKALQKNDKKAETPREC